MTEYQVKEITKLAIGHSNNISDRDKEVLKHAVDEANNIDQVSAVLIWAYCICMRNTRNWWSNCLMY